MKPRILDIARLSGSVFPFSQFKTVNEVTPRRSPTSFCERPSSSRRFLIRSPRVCGSKLKDFFLMDLRHTRTNGKKATRLCPCGYLGHFNGKCRCTPDQVSRYRGKISGPLLDRIDIQIEVPAVPQEALLKQADGETSAAIQQRVEAARQRAMARQGKPNAQLSVSEIDALCAPEELVRLRALLDQQVRPYLGMITRLANRFQRRLLARDAWGRPTRPATRLGFYVRSHWLRMPPRMLARHLWIKWRRRGAPA